MDFRTFKNRLNLDVTYYKENTKDQIMEIATPWVSGISTQLINAGNIQNQGIELALNTIPFQNEDWEWGLDFTWTKNTSKIVELHPDAAEYISLAAKIILPLARPAIIVTAVMVLIFVWNEYLFATTFMLREESYTLAGGLYQLQANDYSRSWPLFSAAAILVSVPILIIFFCIQKYMVSGLTAGGVKG